MGFDVYLEKINHSKENTDRAGYGSECAARYGDETEPPYHIYVKTGEPAGK